MTTAYRRGSARARVHKGVSVLVALLTVAVFPLLLPGASAGVARARTPVGGPVLTLARGEVGSPAVAIDRFGTTTVVWAADYWEGPVQAMRRPSGGQWSQPVTLGAGTDPHIGVDNQGAVTVVWKSNRENYSTGVLAARRPPAGPWQAPVRLSEDVSSPLYPDFDASIGADALDLSVSPGGATLVAWEWGGYDWEVPYRIEAVYRPAAGPWGHPVTLRAPRSDLVFELAVAAGRGGAAQVVYPAYEQGPLVVRRRLETGAWAPEATMWSRASHGYELLMDPAGDATVLVDGGPAVFAVRRPAAGPWGAPVRVGPGDLAGAVVDRGGTVSAAVLPGQARLQVVRRPRRGAWGSPLTIGSTRAGSNVTMSVSHAGDLLTAWDNPQEDLVARGRVTGKGWTAPFQVLRSGGLVNHLTSAASKGGGGVFAWQRNDVVQLRSFR